MKLTKTAIRNMTPPAKETWHCDDKLPGFGLRVWPTGKAMFVLRYRTLAGTHRKLIIGDARALDPDEARDLARKKLVAVREGRDPQKERTVLKQAETIDDLATAWLARQKGHVKATTYRGATISWNVHIKPKFGSVKLRELTRDEVSDWHQTHRRKFAANAAVQELTAALTWAQETKGWLTKNPLKKFRYYANRRRQMVLTPEQIKSLIAALNSETPRRWAAPYLFKLLLFTGLRLREWSMAEWSQFSDTTGTLTLHDSKTGPRTVQLGEDARIILRQIRSQPKAHDRWIFPNSTSPGPLKFPHSYWNAVRVRVGLPSLRVHDLRHTYATYGLLAGANMKEVQQMLGHRSIKTTERYVGIFDTALQATQGRVSKAILDIALTGQLPDTASPARRKPTAVA
jgi:hypothetical protein